MLRRRFLCLFISFISFEGNSKTYIAKIKLKNNDELRDKAVNYSDKKGHGMLCIEQALTKLSEAELS